MNRRRPGSLPLRQRGVGLSITEILQCREWLDDAEILLLFSQFDGGDLDIDEKALCYDAVIILLQAVIDTYTPRQPIYIGPRIRFRRTVDYFSDSECRIHFRINTQEKLRAVLHAWDVPDRLVAQNGSVFSGEEAFLMFLDRFSYPKRYVDMETTFGCEETQINRAVNGMINFMYDKHAFRMHNNLAFWQPYFSKWNEKIICHIHDRGHPIPPAAQFCSNWCDCTVKESCRIRGQNMFQLVIYDRHHKIHALKYGLLTSPAFDAVDMSSGLEGGRILHDQRVEIEHTDLNTRFKNVQDAAGVPPHQQFKYYKDKGFYNTSHSIAAHHGPNLTEMELYENNIMKSPRGMGVENFFNIVDTHWKLVTLVSTQRIFLSDISRWYVLACLLSNTRNCLENNSTGEYFNCNSRFPMAILFFSCL
jgi:hypothetical protein